MIHFKKYFCSFLTLKIKFERNFDFITKKGAKDKQQNKKNKNKFCD